jgi:galactokinase
VRFSGFNAAIQSTLPIGAGLASSAALTVATALSVRKLFPYRLTALGAAEPPQRDRHGVLPPLRVDDKWHIAKLCQAAESRVVGVDGGLLDPLSVLFGQAFHALEIDFRSMSVRPVPFQGEVSVIVCDSGVKPALSCSAQHRLRQHCESAARALRAKTLRLVEPKDLAVARPRLDPRAYECAYHVVGEIQRVVYGERALSVGDFAQFGQYLFQSHESSRDFFKNSCAELDLLVERAQTQPGCLGARLTGGGFGGATVNLVEPGQVEVFMEAVVRQYAERTGCALTPWRCQIVDGAQ